MDSPKVWQKNADTNRLQRVDVEDGLASPTKKRRGSRAAGTSSEAETSSVDNRTQLVEDVTEAVLRYEQPGSKLYNQALQLAQTCPQLKVWAERQPNVLVQTIENLAPGVTRADATAIASFFLPKPGSQQLEGRSWSLSINDNTLLQYNISHSYQSKGAWAKGSPVDPTLPQNSIHASLPYRKEDWDKVLSMGTSHENAMAALVSAADLRGCFFELRVTGAIQTVDSLKPDVLLILKGHPLRSSKAVGALINLQSASSGCYDSDADVGKIITLAQVFLSKAGPVRKSIVVGVSDFQMIRFFRVKRAAEEDSLFVSYLNGFDV